MEYLCEWFLVPFSQAVIASDFPIQSTACSDLPLPPFLQCEYSCLWSLTGSQIMNFFVGVISNLAPFFRLICLFAPQIMPGAII